jgi:hypothetical protein
MPYIRNGIDEDQMQIDADNRDGHDTEAGLWM